MYITRKTIRGPHRTRDSVHARELFATLLSMALFLLLYPSNAVAAVVTNSAGAGADNASNGGTVVWTTPGSITSADSSTTTATTSSKTAVTDYIQASALGFNIPAGSVINGVIVNVLRSASAASSAKNFSDAEVRLLKNGVVSSAINKADTATLWPATAATAFYGATNDLWQETWEASDLNNSGFGVVVSAARNGTGGGGLSADVDHITVTISYDPPAAQYTLTVNSDHGTPDPSGVTTSDWNTVINAVLPDSPIANGTTQYICTGWTGTGSASSGSGTNLSFTITNDTTITWQWQTNYWMNFEIAGN